MKCGAVVDWEWQSSQDDDGDDDAIEVWNWSEIVGYGSVLLLPGVGCLSVFSQSAFIAIHATNHRYRLYLCVD